MLTAASKEAFMSYSFLSVNLCSSFLLLLMYRSKIDFLFSCLGLLDYNLRNLLISFWFEIFSPTSGEGVLFESSTLLLLLTLSCLLQAVSAF